MRDECAQGGFSLVELLVAVLVVGILVASAMPTFLGASTGSREKAAQTVARLALTTQFSVYLDLDAYSADPSVLAEVEPSLAYTGALSALTAGSEVFVAVSTATKANDVVVIASKSSAGDCYWIHRLASAVPRYAVNDCSSEPAAGDWAAVWD